MLIQIIGLIILYDESFGTSVLNHVLFFLSLNFSYWLIKNKQIIINSNSLVITSLKSIKLFANFNIVLLVLFFLNVGIIFNYDGDLLLGRKEILSFANGIFARIILVFFPIISSVFLIKFIKFKDYKSLIYPIACLVSLVFVGYRGFLFWTVLFFIMLINYYRTTKVTELRLLIYMSFAVFFLVYITNLYYQGGDLYASFDLLYKRVLTDSVYGNYHLIEFYIPKSGGKIDFSSLGKDLFLDEYGRSGRLSELGAELTYTLPGFTYAFGGYIFSILIALVLGIISSYLHKLNLYKKNIQIIAVIFRTFILYSILSLMVRGYVFNFFKISLLSILISYILIFMSSSWTKYKYAKK
jgi:hypothetical protein